MRLPAWTIPALVSGAICLLVGSMIPPYGLGYINPRVAEAIARERAEDVEIRLMTPLCFAKFRALPEFEAKRKELKEAEPYDRRHMFPPELVTLEGQSTPNNLLVRNCTDLILADDVK